MRHGHRGMTLLEFIVVAFVFSMLMLSLTQLIIGALRAYKRGDAQTNLKSEARAAIDLISADFRQCNGNLSSIYPNYLSSEQANALVFMRYDNAGSPLSITYTILAAERKLVRRNNNTGTVTLVADNVVYQDPRDNIVKSYFQWDQATGGGGRTMIVQLYLVENAQGMTGGDTSFRESLTLSSKVSMRSTTVTNDPLIRIINPTSLARPSRFFHRTAASLEFL